MKYYKEEEILNKKIYANEEYCIDVLKYFYKINHPHAIFRYEETSIIEKITKSAYCIVYYDNFNELRGFDISKKCFFYFHRNKDLYKHQPHKEGDCYDFNGFLELRQKLKPRNEELVKLEIECLDAEIAKDTNVLKNKRNKMKEITNPNNELTIMDSFYKKVISFHKSFGIKPYSGNIDDDFINLRYNLFKEELEEYKGAKTLTDKVDAICDMLYIVLGSAYLTKTYIKNQKYNLSNSINETDFLYNIFALNERFGRKEKGKRVVFNQIIIEILELARINKVLDILPELFNEVHESNMSKLDKQGKPIINGENGVFDKTRPMGKVLKSELFREPDLEKILKKHKLI